MTLTLRNSKKLHLNQCNIGVFNRQQMTWNTQSQALKFSWMLAFEYDVEKY